MGRAWCTARSWQASPALLLKLAWSAAVLASVLAGPREDKISFMVGSCSKVDQPQVFWDLILQRNPAAWIWMGDNIYADVKRPKWKMLMALANSFLSPMGFEQVLFEPANASRIQMLYQRQLEIPGYAKLVKKKVPILGVWDDHDYGLNDGDRTYIHKEDSMKLFLDFLGEPGNSARRTQQGVYGSRIFKVGRRKVMVVLLDNRWSKSPYRTWPARLQDWNMDGDFLGDEQWNWLNDTLRQSRCDAHLIVSGLQVLPELRWISENWSRFRRARQKLLDLVLNSGAKGPILLSGDVHYAEVSKATCKAVGSVEGDGNLVESRELYEMTSSGMTHTWGTKGVLSRYLFRVYMSLYPFQYQSNGYFTGLNIGQIDVIFPRDGIASRAELNIVDPNGSHYLFHTVPLEPHETRPATESWSCEGHKGDSSGFHTVIADTVVISVILGIYLAGPLAVICVIMFLLQVSIEKVASVNLMVLKHQHLQR